MRAHRRPRVVWGRPRAVIANSRVPSTTHISSIEILVFSPLTRVTNCPTPSSPSLCSYRLLDVETEDNTQTTVYEVRKKDVTK